MVDIERLKAASPILEVAADLGLQLKREGSGWKTRCFAHNDTGRPNLHIYPDGGAKCFSCGWAGDVIDMVAEVKGVSKGEAIRWLAERAGLQTGPAPARPGQSRPAAPKRPDSPRPPTPPSGPDQVSESQRIEVLGRLLSYTQHVDPLRPSPGHSWLLSAKGITYTTQRAFGIRWLADYQAANRGLKEAFGVDLLGRLGLLSAKKEDGSGQNLVFYRHRLLFPFYKAYSPVYIQGRDVEAVQKQGRFINASSMTPCLYNIDTLEAAREDQQPVIICEGATDTMTLAQAGYHAVGIVGVSGFKRHWVSLFDGLSVFLAFDGDPAGHKASQEVAQAFAAAGQPAPRIVPIPEGQDVTEFFLERVKLT